VMTSLGESVEARHGEAAHNGTWHDGQVDPAGVAACGYNILLTHRPSLSFDPPDLAQ